MVLVWSLGGLASYDSASTIVLFHSFWAVLGLGLVVQVDSLHCLHWPNTMTSEMSSPRKPLTSSHHGRHGTMPLISHLRLNSLTPRHSPCPLQNRRSLTTSSRRTLQMAASIHPSPLWEPLCSLSRRRMVHSASYRTIRSWMRSQSRTPAPSPLSPMS